MHYSKLILSSLITFTLLIGCSSSNNEQQKTIENMVEHRATVLSAGLPYETGPLSVMKAIAKHGVIEIVMLYNTDDVRATVTPDALVKNSIKAYCASSEVITNLEQGIDYKITLRNSRGKLLVEQLVSAADCKK